MIIPHIYALQDDTCTSLMLRVGGDPPVCVFRYSRELARMAKSVTGIEISSTGCPADADYTGFLMQTGVAP